MGGPDKPLTVLVAEDDPVVRRALERSLLADPRLAAKNVVVLGAADGRQALALMGEQRPDVLVTDLFMPRMDGFALCRAVRASPATDALPIIVTSGVYKDPALVSELTVELLARFVPKPIDFGQLATTILELAGREQKGTLNGPAAATPAATQDPLVAGSLSDRTVPRLLLEHLERASTGTLLLVRGQMRKELFLRDGRTVGAESNMRSEALGNLLVSRGVIDEEQLQFLLTEAKKKGQKMGGMLVELGWLSPEEVLKFLGAQARRRVADCLRWNEGSYSFIPGDAFSERAIEHEFDVVRLIFTALQRTGVPDTLLARFSAQSQRRVHLSPRFANYKEAYESIFGTTIAPLLSEAPTLGSVLERPDASLVMMGIEALVLAGLAEVDEHGIEVAPPVSALQPIDPGDSFSLERLQHTKIRGGGLAASAIELPDLEFDDGFEEGAHMGLDSAGARGASAGAVPEPINTSDESGVVHLGPSSIAPVAPVPIEDQRHDKKQAVLREYLAVHGKSLYDVLGVARNASRSAVVEAHRERMRKLAPEQYAGVDLGADQPKLEAVLAAYQRALKVLSDPVLRHGYDATLDERSGEPDAIGAELAFHEGLALLGDGHHAQAAERLAAAAEQRPGEAAYHAFLGWAIYLTDGTAGLERARTSLEQAIALDGDQVDGHAFLGRLALDEGDEARARIELERALELDPTREEVLDALLPLYASADDQHAREWLYRRMIHALGERPHPLRLRLWRELAELYERELASRDNARIAYDVAARLAPDDVALQRKVVELNQEDPGRWRELARGLAAEWRVRPEDLALGSALLDLLLRVGQNDGATLAASALVLRGSTAAEAHRLAESHRPRLLPRIARPLDSQTFELIRHPNEDNDLEALFFVLAEEGLLAYFEDTDVGVGTQAALAPERLPPTFGRVLRYVCHVIGAPEPARVFEYEPLANDARLADTRPVALLVGPSLLASQDTVELGFRLARALSYSNPGRVAGSSRSGRQLRPYLLAAMALARRTLATDDAVDPQLRQALENARPSVRYRIVDIGARLLRDRAAINLTAWSRAMNRTATRLGLLVSADPLRVGRAVGEEEGPEALEELLEFALSVEHFELREALGLAAVV